MRGRGTGGVVAVPAVWEGGFGWGVGCVVGESGGAADEFAEGGQRRRGVDRGNGDGAGVQRWEGEGGGDEEDDCEYGAEREVGHCRSVDQTKA